MAHQEQGYESSSTVTNTFKRVVDDVRDLLREEIALARAEIRQEVSSFSNAAVLMAAGAVAGLLALAFLLHAAAQGFATAVGWPSWTGYLAVSIVLAVIGMVALQMGRNRLRATATVPPQTAETLQENKEWLKHRMTSERK
jgi:TRAP-type C4-dicarboxylate transport system permease small subunit